MENKLRLENIGPYLPYGLKGVYSLQKVTGSLKDEVREEILTGLNPDFFVKFCTPYLRPMDLTKPIIVDGKEIIPIVELAKIAISQKIRYGNDHFFTNISSKYYEAGNVLYFKEGGSYYHFGVDCSHSLQRIGCSLIRDNTIHYFLNQLELFKKLYEWKFDLEGLIEKGMAIDCNTLNENPYNS